MMKTPEELAEEWIEKNGWNIEPFRDEYTIEFKKQGYIAGYQAAKETYEARIKELEQAIIQSVDIMAGVKYDDENT